MTRRFVTTYLDSLELPPDEWENTVTAIIKSTLSRLLEHVEEGLTTPIWSVPFQLISNMPEMERARLILKGFQEARKRLEVSLGRPVDNRDDRDLIEGVYAKTREPGKDFPGTQIEFEAGLCRGPNSVMSLIIGCAGDIKFIALLSNPQGSA